MPVEFYVPSSSTSTANWSSNYYSSYNNYYYYEPEIQKNEGFYKVDPKEPEEPEELALWDQI